MTRRSISSNSELVRSFRSNSHTTIRTISRTTAVGSSVRRSGIEGIRSGMVLECGLEGSRFVFAEGSATVPGFGPSQGGSLSINGNQPYPSCETAVSSVTAFDELGPPSGACQVKLQRRIVLPCIRARQVQTN